MKTVTRSNIYLSMAAMILTAAVAFPAAQKQVPFKGTMQGNDIDSQGPCGAPVPNSPFVCVTTSGTGIGTQLGQFLFTQQVTINVAALPLTGTGSAHWVAANGDSIDMTITGS